MTSAIPGGRRRHAGPSSWVGGSARAALSRSTSAIRDLRAHERDDDDKPHTKLAIDLVREVMSFDPLQQSVERPVSLDTKGLEGVLKQLATLVEKARR